MASLEQLKASSALILMILFYTQASGHVVIAFSLGVFS